MRYRPLELPDLPEIARLYAQMLHESKGQPTLHYPRWDMTTVVEMQGYLYRQLTDPAPNGPEFLSVIGAMGGAIGPDGVFHGGRPKGMIFGTIYVRPIGEPKRVGHADLLYVDPSQRAGRGAKAVAVELIRRLAVEAATRYPDVVLEGSYMPGSHGSRLWPRLGLKPYMTYAAFVDADGMPRPVEALFRGRHLRSIPRREVMYGTDARR